MQHKLQFNFLKIIFLLGLLVLEGPSVSFAQDSTDPTLEAPQVREAANPTTNPNIDTEKPTEAPQEEHDTQDLEKLLQRYNTDQKKILEDTSKLHLEGNGDGTVVDDRDIEEMRGSPVDSETVLAEATKKAMNKALAKKPKVISSELSNSVRMALEPLQQLSEEELIKRMDEATKDSSVRPYMNQFPNSTLFAIRLIKDKESIPSMVKIVEDRDRFVWFIGVMLSTIIFGYFLKKFMHREGRPFWKSVLYFFGRMYLLFGIRVGIVIYFFNNELAPAAKVFKKTFID